MNSRIEKVKAYKTPDGKIFAGPGSEFHAKMHADMLLRQENKDSIVEKARKIFGINASADSTPTEKEFDIVEGIASEIFEPEDMEELVEQLTDALNSTQAIEFFRMLCDEIEKRWKQSIHPELNVC